MAQKSAENKKRKIGWPPAVRYENEGRKGRRLFAALLAAMILGTALPETALASEISVWTPTPEAAGEENARENSSEASAGTAETGTLPETETPDPSGSDDSLPDEPESTETAVQREKRYLLEALDELQEMGLSPILIWSEITKDQRVLSTLDDMKDSVTDTVTQKVSEAGAAATKAVGDAVQNEAEKAKKSLMQMIREQIQHFLDGLLPGSSQDEEQTSS